MTEGITDAEKHPHSSTRLLCTSSTQSSSSSCKAAADQTLLDRFQTLKTIKAIWAICTLRLRGWATPAPAALPLLSRLTLQALAKKEEIPGIPSSALGLVLHKFGQRLLLRGQLMLSSYCCERSTFIYFPSLPAYPASLGEWSAVVSSTATLTSLLDWQGFKLLSPLGGGGTFLFFLAKKFLKVWNLDFFFPATWKGKENLWKLVVLLSLGNVIS